MRAVAAGMRHSAAVGVDGRLYAWGDNRFGQLGRACSELRRSSTPVEVALPPECGRVREVVCCWNTTLLVDEHGQLFAFGRSNYGQTGVVSQDSAQGHRIVRVLSVEQHGAVEQLCCGSEHVFAACRRPCRRSADSDAAREDSELIAWCWGWNEHGNVGNGECSDVALPPVQIRPPALRTPGVLGAGYGCTFMTAADAVV